MSRFTVVLGILCIALSSGCDSDPGGCPDDQASCDGVCVDVQIHPDNCGACGNACGQGEVCTAGTCATACGAGLTECNGMCVDTDVDPAYCGNCDTACGTGEYCAAGVCTAGSGCGTGLTECNGECVDTDVDPDYCGNCDTACDPGQFCSAGVCSSSCGTGLTQCGKLCVDTDVDPDFCGDCDTTCADGEFCSDGTCATSCGGDLTQCGELCVDTDVDPDFCGDCETACGDGEYCSAGSCMSGGCGDLTECGGLCVDTMSNPDYCGDCETSCTFENGSGVCVAGECFLWACDADYDDCDDDESTGCEADLLADMENCGTCGMACASECLDGECVRLDFQVSTLDDTCTAVDHDSLTGDDRGGIAVSTDYFYYQGDSNLGRFNIEDASGGFEVLSGTADFFVGLVGGDGLYRLAADGVALERYAGVIEANQLLEMNPETFEETGTIIDLTESISIDTGAWSIAGVFAGRDAFLILIGGTLWEIQVPTGMVTDLGAVTASAYTCENWAYWGIAEFVDGEYSLVYRNSSSSEIVRQAVSDGTVTTISTFTSISDMCSISFSIPANRWVFHHESSGQWGGGWETAGSCSASWTGTEFCTDTIDNDGDGDADCADDDCSDHPSCV